MTHYRDDVLPEMRIRVVQRCKRDNDQCTPKYGTRAECEKMETHYAWKCPQCGRTYSHDMAFAYREEYWERRPIPEGGTT